MELEVAIQNPSSNCDGDLNVGRNPLDEPDVLMNNSIMNEPQDARVSYLAILRSLYEILGVDYPLDCDLHGNVSKAAAVCCNDHVSSGDADAHESGSVNLLNQSTGDILHEQTVNYYGQVGNIANVREAHRAQECSANFANCEVEGKSTEESVCSEGTRFEKFNLLTDCTGLYILGELPETFDRSFRAAHRSMQREQSNPSAARESLYVEGRLEICAEAVAAGEFTKANDILHDLYHFHGVSLQGHSLQRVAYYFCDALVARMEGMGGYLYKYTQQNLPLVVPIAKVWLRLFPYGGITYYFANYSIFKVAEGSSRLHILEFGHLLDFGIMHGIQWAYLINALADRRGGPPLLVITGIGKSPPHQDSLQNIKETGERLAIYARLRKVPFQFHAVVTENWQDINAASLQIQEGELLVVNSVMRLHHLPDESPDLTSPVPSRQKFFMILRNLNPHLLITADFSAPCNSPFFVSRFRETFRRYQAMADTLDTVAGGGDADWLFLEQSFWAREILNIVACEGADRVERPENYRQWDAHISRAGFELLPIPSAALSASKSYVMHEHHPNFIVHREAGGWMSVGWKGRPMVAMSAWKPRPYTYSSSSSTSVDFCREVGLRRLSSSCRTGTAFLEGETKREAERVRRTLH